MTRHSEGPDWTQLDPVHPDIADLLAEGRPDDGRIEAFMARIPLPLAEPGALTFLWKGHARAVEILRWINAGVDRDHFVRMAGTDIWYLRLPVEDGGRFEYKLSIHAHDGEHWILDPANPNRAGDPFGENSVAMTWGYERPEWSIPMGAARGTLDDMHVPSTAFGGARREQVYLPAGYDRDRPYPLVIIHDGGDFETYADLTVSLDNLIAEEAIPPVVAVLIQAGDRMSEYPRGRRHARYVVQDLLPVVSESYAISPHPHDRILLGASLGAVASLSTAFRYPGIFGGLVLKSGSFILDREKLSQRPHPVFQRVARIVEVIRRAPDLTATRAFVSTGELEGLAEENRAMADLLREKGVDVKFQTAWDGHHWHNWRDQLRDALTWVLKPDGDNS